MLPLVLIVLFSQLLSAQTNTYDNSVVKVHVIAEDADGKLSIGHGTGFVVSDEGHIATNWHVVNNAVSIFVLRDGERVDLMKGHDVDNKFAGANVESNPWSSPDLDLAVIKVKSDYWDSLHLTPVTLSGVRPSPGSRLFTRGYPGIAENSDVESTDITANSTYVSGELGSIRTDGVWSSSRGLSVVLLLHTVPTSGGNSGGPLFDECGRVVGVHSASPTEQSRVYNARGEQVAVGSVANAAYGWASAIEELLPVLDSRGVDYQLDNTHCLSESDRFQQKNEELSDVLQIALYGGGAAFLVMAMLLVYALRNPAAREKVSHAVESYSRSIRRSPQSAKSNQTFRAPGAEAHASASAPVNLILDGYGQGEKRYRLVISGKDLFAGDVVVGRSPPNMEYRIDDDSVSRQHCVFYAKQNELLVRDNHSTNGTFVDGRKLNAGAAASLQSGTDIKIGSVKFRVIAG